MVYNAPMLLVREDRGKVRLLLIDRPPSNGLTLELLDALTREVEEAGRDPAVRCVLLASKNPKYFSSGLDLDEMLSLAGADSLKLFDRVTGAHRALASLPKPTVAAVEGAALLGGFVVALGCDWRLLAAETGKISLSEIRLGLSPGSPLARLVFALTGRPGLAKELLLQGKTLRAQEALEAGLADSLLPAEGFLDAAAREAQRLARLAPGAYASIKRSIRAALIPQEDALWEAGRREFAEIFASPEAQEGLSAMREKRKPRWE